MVRVGPVTCKVACARCQKQGPLGTIVVCARLHLGYDDDPQRIGEADTNVRWPVFFTHGHDEVEETTPPKDGQSNLSSWHMMLLGSRKGGLTKFARCQELRTQRDTS